MVKTLRTSGGDYSAYAAFATDLINGVYAGENVVLEMEAGASFNTTTDVFNIASPPASVTLCTDPANLASGPATIVLGAPFVLDFAGDLTLRNFKLLVTTNDAIQLGESNQAVLNLLVENMIFGNGSGPGLAGRDTVTLRNSLIYAKNSATGPATMRVLGMSGYGTHRTALTVEGNVFIIRNTASDGARNPKLALDSTSDVLSLQCERNYMWNYGSASNALNIAKPGTIGTDVTQDNYYDRNPLFVDTLVSTPQEAVTTVLARNWTTQVGSPLRQGALVAYASTFDILGTRRKGM